MSNIIDKIQLSGVTYDIGGGGSSYSAGTGIDITNSVISISLPISAGTGSNSIIEGYTGNTASGEYSHAEGYNTTASTDYVHAEGYSTKASGLFAHAEGGNTSANGTYSHAEGNCTITTNKVEHASGQFNTSNKANTTFGDSGNTLFSVGNGTANNARHNAFEIRQNGDIYISSGGTDIKLQDHLGGGGSSYTAGDGIDITNDVISVTGKQDTLSAGTNITIVDNVISATGGGGKAIEAGRGISVTTGETADTVSLDINAKKGSTNTALVFNYINSNTATAAGATSFGYMCKATNQYTFANGNNTQARGYYSHSEGESTIANGWGSHSDGQYTNANGKASHTEGSYVNAENDYESSQGRYNVSNKANTTWGNSGNTLFSVGNGTANNARHNAFEIRQNGDIYITKDGQDVKLQDQLGGGGGGTVESAITSGSTNAVESKAIWSAVTYDVSINETLEFDNTYAATNYPSGCNSVAFESNTGGTLSTGDYVFTSGGSEVAKLTCSVISWWPYEVGWTSSDPKLTYVVAEGNSAVTASYSELASDIDGVTVPSAFTSASTATASGENHLWINENTYRKDEVYNKSEINVLSGVVDTKLDATAYTPTVVDLRLNSGSTNPVQNQVLYDQLEIPVETTETTLTFNSDRMSTNYPTGCKRLKIETQNSTWSQIYLTTRDEAQSTYYGIYWTNFDGNSLNVSMSSGLTEAGATYTINGKTIELSYPTLSDIEFVYASSLYTGEVVKAVEVNSTTAVKNQVVANTTALGGLSLVKLTQAQYDALATKDNSTLYVIVG